MLRCLSGGVLIAFVFVQGIVMGQKLESPVYAVAKKAMNKSTQKFDAFVVNGKEPCLYDQLREKRMQDPQYREMMACYEAEIQRRSERIKRQRPNEKAAVYTIPIVFHVMHLGEAIGAGSNIPEDQIRSAVKALNRDFRKLNTDGGIAQGQDAVDVEVSFCLATIDPNGNPTNGIKRVNVGSIGQYANIGIDENTNGDVIKNLSRWPSRDYVNIWVVREINDEGDFDNWAGGTLGYAYTVSGEPENDPSRNPSNNKKDGIVVLNFSLGNDPKDEKNWNIRYRLNRTLTHEMGHHLNLQHTFKGGSCEETDCVTEGDFVCDTPPTTLNSNCDDPACQGTQQVGNYMDYTEEDCQNTFTAGQKIRMRAVLEGFSRSTLPTDGVCGADILKADFSVADTSVMIGQPLAFNDLTIASPKVTTWSWDFGDGNTSSVPSPTHSYQEVGIYEVRLTVANKNGTSTKIKKSYVYVDKATVATETIGGPCSELRNYTYTEAGNFTTFTWGSNEPIPAVYNGSFHGFAEHFNYPSTVTFDEVKLDLGYVNVVDSGAFNVNVYEAKNGQPGAVISNGLVKVTECIPYATLSVKLTNPVTIEGEFFVGFEFEATHDVVQVYATEFRTNGFGTLFAKTTDWNEFQVNFSMAVSVVPLQSAQPAVLDFPVLLNGDTLIDICNDKSVTFELNHPHNVKAYQWSFSPEASPTSSTDSMAIVSFPNQGNVMYSVELFGLCGDTISLQGEAMIHENPNISVQINDAFCDEKNGSIELTHTGKEVMNYHWINANNTTNTLDSIGKGEYAVKVTNGSCSYADTFVVGRFPDDILATFYSEKAVCGKPNGTIAVLPQTAGDYEYFWDESNVSEGDTLYNLLPGVYAVQILNEGCEVFTGESTVGNIQEPFDFQVTSVNADCQENNGRITVKNNGNPDVSFNWVGQTNTSDTLKDIPAGTYVLQLTNGTCFLEESIAVESNPGDTVSSKITVADDACEKGTGEVTINMAREGNYKFIIGDSISSDTHVIGNLKTGTYALRVKEFGCPVNDTSFVIGAKGMLPNVGFTSTPNPIVANDPVTFMSQFPSAGEHTWMVDGVEIAKGEDTVTTIFEAQGIKELLLLVEGNECSNVLMQEIDVMNNVAIAGIQNMIKKVMPNPVSDVLTLILDRSEAVDQILVTDLLGRSVSVPFQQNGEQLQFNAAGIANGHYQLLLTVSGSNTITTRFVVNH